MRTALGAAEKQSGNGRKQALTQLASQLNGDASSASDSAKVKMLVDAVNELAK